MIQIVRDVKDTFYLIMQIWVECDRLKGALAISIIMPIMMVLKGYMLLDYDANRERL